MCGIIGIVAKGAVNQTLYDGLTVLQHRGQDAAGMITYDRGRLFLRKRMGLVRDVFHTRHMLNLKGDVGIGHVRYPTAGCSSSAEAQPFYVNSPYGVCLAHNGNLVNAEALKDQLYREGLRHINTESDSEVLLNVFAHELQRLGKLRIDADDIFSAMRQVYRRCVGGFAAIAMINGVGIIGFRDPNGIRPIVFGRRETERGIEHIIASESAAISVLGFELVRDIRPGEVVFISADGQVHAQICADETRYAPCIFEHVYLARPDSIIDGISVHKARLRMGETLAKKILRVWPGHDIDVVIPVPETSRTSALELANSLGIKYREGFIKNRYIPRTFIMPGQAMRKKSIRQKLNAIDLEFRGKNVLLVDDSIVRGNTSGQIIQMAREVGANKVFFASAAPPVRFPNVYGIDIPSGAELIAYQRTEQEVAELLGADYLVYQDLDDLVEAARRGNPNVKDFDTSVFSGEYVTEGVSAAYLNHIEELRSDEAKQRQDQNKLNDLYKTA
jgi:amidophosphoribosyltransferase